MDGRTIGIIGGIIGSVFGLMGGVIGTYVSTRNTRTPAERSFVIKCGIGIWAAVLLVALLNILAMVRVIPDWLGLGFLILFFILLTPAIMWINKRQYTLRQKRG